MAKAGSDHDVNIDVDVLTMGLKRKMSGHLTMPSTCSIFRIPTILSRHSPNAYTPNQFSFGPFHHYNKNLQPTERIKSKYLLDLVSRYSQSYNQNPYPPSDRDTLLKTLTQAITKFRKQAREYYAGPIDPMTEAEFVEVLVLDGCFIVELFRKKSYESLRATDDPVFNMSCLLQFLLHDLILLENQVPWMVLEILFDLTVMQIDTKPLVQLAIEFFGNIFSNEPPPIQSLVSELQQSKHILDLLRNSLILPSGALKHKSLSWEGAMRSATTLEGSGIEFKPYNKSQSILDIKFDEKKGVLRIPPLFIQETTQTVLRNLISLEQCCPNYDAVITSYAVLLDNLISTRADMEILCKSKAISTWLNVDEATKFFDKLYIDTYVKETFYLQLTMDVNKYCKRRWPTYRRVLMRDYFRHPWALISVVAATIALILTFVQTVFGIINK